MVVELGIVVMGGLLMVKIVVLYLVMAEEEVWISVVAMLMLVMIFRLLSMTVRQATYRIRRRKLLAISSNVIMTRGSRISEKGGRFVSRHVGTHSAWKSSSSLLVNKGPVISRSRILFCAIHGGDQVPHASRVSTVVFVERALFVVPRCFVQDVDQQCSVLHFYDVTGWNWFINHAGIPVNLQSYCDLREMSPFTKYGKKLNIGPRISQGYALYTSRFTLHGSTAHYPLTIQAHV